MSSVATLIDNAVAICRPPYKAELARVLGVSRQAVSEWHSGKKHMPTATYARLAQIVEGQKAAKDMLWAYVTEPHGADPDG